MARHHHSLWREASDAGFLATVGVVAWLLLWDTVAGHPLGTPNLLGRLLTFGDPANPRLDYIAIVAFLVFSLIGLNLLAALIVSLVHLAIRQPTLLFALLLLFVMFEVFFVGGSYAVLHGAGVSQAWWPILGANLVAVCAMGWYLKRGHRIIDRWMARVPLGDTGDEAEVNTEAAWHAMGSWRHPWTDRLKALARHRGP